MFPLALFAEETGNITSSGISEPAGVSRQSTSEQSGLDNVSPLPSKSSPAEIEELPDEGKPITLPLTQPDISVETVPGSGKPAEEQKPFVPPPAPIIMPGEALPPREQPADSGKQAPEIKSAIPPIPPGVSFTPEQIKTFLSKPQSDDYIILNFDNADLRDVINTVSSITKENFILSPGIDARITIHSATKIPVREILSVFESVLEVNGLAIVKSGNFYKVVLSTTAKQKPIEVRKGNDSGSIPSEELDKPLTQIVPVEYVPAGEISTVLQPMVSQYGSIIPNPRNNLLIINDVASNLKRLLSILKELDVDAFQNTRMAFFQPKYSDVKVISEELTDILNALNLGREGTVALVPIERINSIVVFSSSPSLLKSVEGWMKKLDEEITTGQTIFIFPVQNVKAKDIAEILKTLYVGGEGSQSKISTAVKAPPAGQRQAQTARTLPKPDESGGFSKVEIATFEPTNSLVILAAPGIFREIKEIIKKLDIYPREVLIEVLIAEVTLTNTDQFGIQWSALNSLDIHVEGSDNFTGRAQSSSNLTGAPSLSPTAPLLAGGTAGISYLLFKPDRLVAMIHALASRGKVDVLSSPRLLVRNQEEATIEVGSDIPTSTSTSQTADTTTSSTLTQSIEYKTVGIKLKIKPSINDEKTVVLDIEQEVSEQGSAVTVGQAGYTYPSFSTRKAKTSVVVPDKQGIVIGGIMKEKKDKSYQGVPLLSAIPLLGNLFRYTVNTSSKTELIIILTPHVVADRIEADVLTTEFLGKLKQVKEYLKDIDYSIKKPASTELKPSQTDATENK
jgi:general secretion pathway protein D